MAAANSPVLATSELGSARALNTLAIFAENAKDLESYLKHAVVASKLGTTIILEAAPSASQSQAVHNLSTNEKGPIKMKVPEAKVLLDDACKANANLTYQMETGVYSTNVDGLLAVQAFAEIWDEYDGAAQEIKSSYLNHAGAESTRVKTAVPFDSYGFTVETAIPALQRASTLAFAEWLKDSTTLPKTAELVKQVENSLGLRPQDWTFKRGHLLRYPTPAGSLFKMHTDWGDFTPAQAPHLSACVLLSPSKVSEMQIAAFDESFKFGGPGSVAAFPSGLYHASGRCDARKVLLVLMWRLNPPVKTEVTIDLDQVDEPGSSGAAAAVDPAVAAEIKPLTIKSEPVTEPTGGGVAPGLANAPTGTGDQEEVGGGANVEQAEPPPPHPPPPAHPPPIFAYT